MRKIKTPKIKYIYVAENGTPEQKRESERRQKRFYSWLINEAIKRILERSNSKN